MAAHLPGGFVRRLEATPRADFYFLLRNPRPKCIALKLLPVVKPIVDACFAVGRAEPCRTCRALFIESSLHLKYRHACMESLRNVCYTTNVLEAGP
jgi:hypothetical protein